MAVKHFSPTKDIPSLTGKVILVTGGNNGLGKETVAQLARHQPAKIWMGARSAQKAKSAIDDIKTQLKEEVDIEHVPIDLASLKSVRAAAETVQSKSSRLDVLILNAGVMAIPPSKTEEGFEIQMGTNHVGHFYLTKQLMPLLSKTATTYGDARVLSLSSKASDAARYLVSFDKFISTEKLYATGIWHRYAASKAANIYFAAELARRHPEITSVSLHPGVVMTDLHTPGTFSLMGMSMKLASPIIAVDVPHGAHNQLYLSTAKKEVIKNGQFYIPVGSVSANWAAKDEVKGKKFWEWTEKELEAAGF